MTQRLRVRQKGCFIFVFILNFKLKICKKIKITKFTDRKKSKKRERKQESRKKILKKNKNAPYLVEANLRGKKI